MCAFDCYELYLKKENKIEMRWDNTIIHQQTFNLIYFKTWIEKEAMAYSEVGIKKNWV